MLTTTTRTTAIRTGVDGNTAWTLVADGSGGTWTVFADGSRTRWVPETDSVAL